MSSDRRPLLFWLLQVGGWLAVGVLLVIVRVGVVPLEFMAGVKLVFSTLGFLLMLGLRAVYRRLLRRGAGLPTVIAASVAGSGIAAVLWTVPYNLFLAVAVRWYLGVPYPMGAARQVLHGQGDAEVRDVFGDFRMHASVQLPWALRSYRDGTLTEDIRYTAIHVNATVDERMFAVT
jgi:hypothetical protein